MTLFFFCYDQGDKIVIFPLADLSEIRLVAPVWGKQRWDSLVSDIVLVDQFLNFCFKAACFGHWQSDAVLIPNKTKDAYDRTISH